MRRDPLLSDDLGSLLASFPNHALRDLVGILKQHKTYSIFPARRAYAAHALPADGDFTPHAKAIAEEILWWGSHELARQVATPPGWKEILISTAEHLAVAKDERQPTLPAWSIEDAVFRKALAAWEHLPLAEREAAMKKAGLDLGSAKGAVVAAAGGAASLGAPQLLAFLAARGVGAVVPFVGPVLAAVGTVWAAYDLAGPGYRVLRPATLMIAYHRRRLREERLASAFRD